jgi:PAS domain S-box-containing protein
MTYEDRSPELEDARLEALRGFCVLDTEPQPQFDRITALVADIYDVPIALVSLIDVDRQWFKSRLGLEATQTPRDVAFCAHVLPMGGQAVLIVPDATLDPRFADNPLVTGGPRIRFYMGAALTTKSGQNLGALCAVDTKPRARPSHREIERLKALAQIVMDELELGVAQRELEEGRRLLEMAETTSGVGHWRVDLINGRRAWSDEVYRIHGVDKTSFDPNTAPAFDFCHPQDREAVVARIARARADGEGFEVRYRLMRADGAIRHVVARAKSQPDALGRIATTFGVLQDITDEVLALEAVKKSERQYRLLTENANDVVAEISPSGVFNYVSPAVEAMSGYRADEVIGRSALDFIHPEDRERTRDRFGEALAQIDRLRVEYRVCRKDGDVIWVEARPRPVFDPVTGEFTCFTDVFRDVTERRALEAATEAARAEAEAAAAVKAEFLANMSHELRTPLTSMLGYADLLRPRVDADATARRYLDRMVMASQALLAIVNEVLDFSKLEAGQVEIVLKPTDLTALFASVTELVAPQAAAKGLELTFAPAPNLPPEVWMDDARVRQILLNFASNAIKFTDKGSVTITLARIGSMLRCEVVDTGRGVDANKLDRLFKRFSQVDAADTPHSGGTGLGLAICKGLAEAMGGRVGVTSTLGAGSNFWFEVPCAPVTEAPAEPSKATEAPTSPLQGLRLLIVDDNPMNRELINVLMSAVGADVSEAASGEEAVSVARTSPFDIILMDMRMPGLSGSDAARAIRAGGGCNVKTPILAFTAHAEQSGRGAAFGAVFAGAIAKPVIAADLYAVLTDIALGSTTALQMASVAS